MTRTLDEYLDLPYRIALTRDSDEEGNAGWVAEVEALPGCISQGETPEEAVANIRDAMEGWISVMLEDGKPIPEPRDPAYSGRVLLRMPVTLHAELARSAEREGTSLNTFMTNALAGAVSWRNASEGTFVAKGTNGRAHRKKVTSRSTPSSSSTRRKTTRRRPRRSPGGRRAA
jgi:antitoxin HicB